MKKDSLDGIKTILGVGFGLFVVFFAVVCAILLAFKIFGVK